MDGVSFRCGRGLGWAECLATIVDAGRQKPAERRANRRISGKLGCSLGKMGIRQVLELCLPITCFLFFEEVTNSGDRGGAPGTIGSEDAILSAPKVRSPRNLGSSQSTGQWALAASLTSSEPR